MYHLKIIAFLFVYNYTGKTSPDLFSSICSVMRSSLSAIGGLLNTISGNEYIIEMGRLYLMDLISANLPSSLRSQDLQAMETKVYYNVVFMQYRIDYCSFFRLSLLHWSQRLVGSFQKKMQPFLRWLWLST